MKSIQSAVFMPLALVLAIWTTAGPALAIDRLKDDVKDLWRKPVVKQAAIGAGIGAATGVLSDRTSVGRGAGIGALTGAGTGLIDQYGMLKGKPMARTVAKGAIIGTGASAATHGSVLKGAAVGAGVGAGTHLLRDYWNDGKR
jgi:hypothetical protein